jgi:hypothetical protein
MWFDSIVIPNGGRVWVILKEEKRLRSRLLKRFRVFFLLSESPIPSPHLE